MVFESLSKFFPFFRILNFFYGYSIFLVVFGRFSKILYDFSTFFSILVAF